MFCQKCGYRMADGSAFCEKCGAKIIVDNSAQLTAVPPNQQQYQQAPEHPIAEGKKHKKHKIGWIIASVVAAFFIIGNLRDDNTDYIASVKAMNPVIESSVTYEELLTDYLESPKWKERKGDNGVVYVDISGTPNDSDKKVVLTIRVEPTDDPEVFWYTPHRLMIDGRGSSDEAAAASFVYELYLAHEYGSGIVDLYKFFQLFA